VTNLRARDYICCGFCRKIMEPGFLKQWGLKNRTLVYESASCLLLPQFRLIGALIRPYGFDSPMKGMLSSERRGLEAPKLVTAL
jgi:hypothetical protein